MAQNSAETARKRGPGRPFPPGVSGNAGGRPKSYGAYIREQTRDGQEIVDMALGIMRNKRAGDRLRLQAGEFLTDRGWGRAEQTTVIRTEEEANRIMAILDAAVTEMFGAEARDKLEERVKAVVQAARGARD